MMFVASESYTVGLLIGTRRLLFPLKEGSAQQISGASGCGAQGGRRHLA